MLILNVIVLIAVAFVIGYFLGKGQIVVRKRLSKAENLAAEKELKEMNAQIKEYNEEMKSIFGGGSK